MGSQIINAKGPITLFDVLLDGMEEGESLTERQAPQKESIQNLRLMGQDAGGVEEPFLQFKGVRTKNGFHVYNEIRYFMDR